MQYQARIGFTDRKLQDPVIEGRSTFLKKKYSVHALVCSKHLNVTLTILLG